MATPTIRINQTGHAAGTPGASRTDLTLGVAVTLDDPANSGAPKVWELFGRPNNSASVIANPTADVATFTPDVAGDYLVRVTVNGTELSGELVDETDEFVSTQGGVRFFLPNGGIRPSAQETRQFSVTQGWAQALDLLVVGSDARLPSTAEKALFAQLPTVGEKASFSRIPTVNEKTDLGQLAGAAHGTVWYANASGRVIGLAPGTPGQVLATTGAGDDPGWIDAGAGGGGGLGTHESVTAHGAVAGASAATVIDDTAAFNATIAAAIAAGKKGVFVPAGFYNITKQSGLGSVILHDLVDFEIVGEGPGTVIRMFGDASDGTWYMIYVNGNCGHIVFRDIAFDGNKDNVTNVEEQTHCVRLGGNSSDLGHVGNVSFSRCWFFNAYGDGIQIVGAPLGHPVAWTTATIVGAGGYRTNAGNVYEALTAGTTGATAPTGIGQSINDGGVIWRFHVAGADVRGGVEDVSVVDCRFISNSRSGIGIQRNCECVRIEGCFFIDTGDQAIDFEPTGGSNPDNFSPQRFIIRGNQIIHTQATICITLTGLNNASPNLDSIFANNEIFGGAIDALDVNNLLFIGNTIIGGSQNSQPTVDFRSNFKKLIFANNTIVRPAPIAPAVDNEAVFIAAQGSDRPTEIQIADNKIEQNGIGQCLVVENCSELSVINNMCVHKHATGTVNQSIFVNASTLQSDNVDVSHNQIINRAAGILSNGIQFAATLPMNSVKAIGNNIRGTLTAKVRFTGTGGFGAFPNVPLVSGNTGGGTSKDIDGMAGNVPIVQISGNQGSAAIGDYIYIADSDPPFQAPDGCTARRLTGSIKGRTVYTREAGNWGTGIIAATSAAFTDRGWPAVDGFYLCNETLVAAALNDTGGGPGLDAAKRLIPNGSPLYQQPSTGWTEVGVGFNEVAAQRFALFSSALYNCNTTSVTYAIWIRIVSCSSTRQFLMLNGDNNVLPLWIGVQSTGLLRLNCANITTDGVFDHRRHVLMMIISYNLTAARFRCRTPYEQITHTTFNATTTDGAQKGLGAGVGTTPNCVVLRVARWLGAGAETIDANNQAVLTSFGW
jgi:hypothetical protein